MEGERYVGERRALSHFLQELRPLVIAALGQDAVLTYRIQRALKSGDLHALRAARTVFHNQPEALKRQLMRGIFEAPSGRAKEEDRPLDHEGVTEPDPCVRFDAYPSARAEEMDLSVALDQDLSDEIPIRVRVSAGTLPSSAAGALREIAEWIERDRRLLSRRHWRITGPNQDRMHRPVRYSGASDQADG